MEKTYNKLQKKVASKIKGEVFVRYSAYKRNRKEEIVDNLDKIVIKGKVFFVQPKDNFFGKKENYISKTVENPTWLDIAILANDMIKTTGDKHHVYLEGIKKINEYYDKTKEFNFNMGS